MVTSHCDFKDIPFMLENLNSKVIHKLAFCIVASAISKECDTVRLIVVSGHTEYVKPFSFCLGTYKSSAEISIVRGFFFFMSVRNKLKFSCLSHPTNILQPGYSTTLIS